MKLVSGSPITPTLNVKRSAYCEKTKLRSTKVIGQNVDYILADRKSVKDKLGNDCLAKYRLQAKFCNDIWPRVNWQESSAIMFAQKGIAEKVLQ